MNLTGTVVIRSGWDMKKICLHLYYVITYFIIDRYEVRKTPVMKHMIISLPLENLSSNIIHLSQFLTIVSSHTFLFSLKEHTRL